MVLAKYLGQLAGMLALLCLPPLAVAALAGDWSMAGRWLAVALPMGAAAVAASRVAPPRGIQVNEALVIVALTFVMASLAMSYPLATGDVPYVDVLFESVSAVTTTGLSTLPGVEDLPPGFLFARAWMQWFGGLGIAVLSVALLMGHHMAARRLQVPEAEGELVTTARTQARRALAAYAVLTLAGLALLWPLLGDGLEALLHTLTGVATGGFSTHDRSIAAFDGWLPRYALMALAVAGAVPLALYAEGPRALARDAEVRALAVAIVAVVALLALLLWWREGLAPTEALAHAGVMGISAQTDTGFSSLAVAELDDSIKLLLVLSMLAGGTTGSTAGGVKMMRLVLILAVIGHMLRRTTLSSRAVLPMRVSGEVVRGEGLERALVLLVLFAMTIFVACMALVLAGHDGIDALFEATSATATVGLSTGIVGPELAPGLKLLLCFTMLLGRVEMIALLLLLYPPTWMGRRAER